MDDLWGAFVQAIHLIVSRDPEVMNIAWRSLWIAAASTAICVVICLPLGSLINFNKFRGKHLLLSLLQTLFSMPTVTVGLFVYVMVSHSGPLGMLDLSPIILIFLLNSAEFFAMPLKKILPHAISRPVKC